ncbi:hypothetical protein ABXK61_28010 [Burkholderia sola]|nr:hypothetical protein [Burkholderia sp. AcTa6-5]
MIFVDFQISQNKIFELIKGAAYEFTASTPRCEFTLNKETTKMIANIGEKCPQGGTWHPVGNPNDTRSIGIGNIMPPTPNGERHWVLKTPTGDK